MSNFTPMCNYNFKQILLLLISILFFRDRAIQAQSRTIRLVHGIVLDDSTKESLSGATVLFGQGPQAVAADVNGRFALIPPMNHPLVLMVSSVGYTTQTLNIRSQALLDTVQVFLHRQSHLLAEAVVKGKMQTIDVDIDKLSVSASSYKGDPSASADNLLKIIPGLRIDQQGQVTLRGDANIQMLVDGKPTLMSGKQFTDWLRSMPVNALKSVEVLSASSARLDAENTGGALNIVLQRQRLDGYRGNVNLGVGTRYNHQASGYLTFKKGHINSSLNAGLYTHPNGGIQSVDRTGITPAGAAYRLLQSGTRDARDHSVNLGANVNWEVDTTLFISSKIFVDLFQLSAQNKVAYVNTTNGLIDEEFYIQQGRKLSNEGVSASFSVDKTYIKGRKLVADALYSYRAESVDNTLYADGNFQSAEFLQTDKNEGALQVRWEQPLSAGNKLEIGTKEVTRFNRAEYPVIAQLGQNDLVQFNQYTAALYGIHNVTLGKWKLQYGFRGEYLLNEFSSIQTARYTKSYFNLFPSAAIFWGEDGRSVRLSYTRKTRRPGISYLNNFVDRRDPKNIAVGNVALTPEFKDVVDFSVTLSKNRINLVNTFYYRRTQDAILPYVTSLAGNTVVTTYTNAGTDETFGINPTLSVDLPKFNFNAGLDVSYYKASAPALNFKNDGFMASVNGSCGYKFNKQWYFDLNALYNSQRILLNGKTLGWSTIGVLIQHSIKDKYVITLNARDIFNTSRFITRYNTESFAYTYDYKPQVQAFIVSVTYRFGKKFDYKEQKSSMQLEDGAERSNR